LEEENTFCLDPSCFVTLQRLEDTMNSLEELTKESKFKVYIPADVYKTIILQPEDKFEKLPKVIKDWLLLDPKKDIRVMNEDHKDRYVSVMRKILGNFHPISVEKVADNIQKLGTESIHRSDVLDLFGKVKGTMLFEMMAVSSRFKAKIIAFGRKTSRFLRQLRITTIEATSKLKHKIKEKRGIVTAMVIMQFAMNLTLIQEFINTYQLDPFPFLLTETASLGAFGVLMIGNGK